MSSLLLVYTKAFARKQFIFTLECYKGRYNALLNLHMQTISTCKEFQDIIECNPRVICTFSASWCGPCKKLHPLLEQMSKENSVQSTSGTPGLEKDIVWLYIDIDKAEELSQEQKIEAVPTLFFFKNGKQESQIVGPTPEQLPDFVKSCV